jgi:CMP-N-acetylneuraminic acid synthetase
MITNKSILGNKFFQFTISNVEAIDVDTMEDFIIAESAYSKLILGSD